MIDTVIVLVSAAALVVAAVQTMLLAHGAVGRERRIWLVVSVALLAGSVSRAVTGIRIAQGLIVELPLAIEIAILTSPVAIVIVLFAIQPTLATYRAAERRRQASDTAFTRSLAESRDPIAIVDAAGLITYMNDAGYTFLRYTPAQIIGHRADTLVAHAVRGLGGSLELADEAGVVQVERDLIRGDGAHIPTECDLVSLGDGRTLIVAHDLTARRDGEALRLHAERLTAIRTLAASIGTDFKDALSFVHSSLELTTELGVDRVPLDAPIAATARALALALMEAFTDLSAPANTTDPAPPHIDIRPIVDDIALSAAIDLDPRMRIQIFPAPHPIMVAATLTDIALMCASLLQHARAAIRESLDATPPGAEFVGHIEMHTAPASSLAALSEVEIVVRDNGGALGTDIRSHMFEPLGEPQIAGLSSRLGLAATHALVLRLGGSLATHHTPGGGTTITIRLPGHEVLPALANGDTTERQSVGSIA